MKRIAIGLTLLVLNQFAFAQAQVRDKGQVPQNVEIRVMRSEIQSLTAAQSQATKDLKDIKTKLDDTGWKALDFAAQMSSAQWVMFGTGVALLALLFTVISVAGGIGVYQIVASRMERRLNATTEAIERRLNVFLASEEKRLREEIEKEMKAMTETNLEVSQARIYGSIGVAFWDQFTMIEGTGDTALNEKVRNIESAIYVARLALRSAEKIGPGVEDRETLLTHSQIALAYYLTDYGLLISKEPKLGKQFSGTDNERALELAATVLPVAERAFKEQSQRAPEWLESYCWVVWNLGRREERPRLLQLLREIYSASATREGTKAWIRERYFQNKEPSF